MSATPSVRVTGPGKAVTPVTEDSREAIPRGTTTPPMTTAGSGVLETSSDVEG